MPDVRGPGARRRDLRPVIAGLLVGFSYIPGPFLPLNLAGFLPLLAWLDEHPDARAWKRLRAGFAFGLTVHLVAMHWQYSMLQSSWLAALLYVGMSAGLGARIALCVTLAGWLRRRTSLGWGLLLPVVWLPFEWAQSWGDLRFTGEHLAHTVAGYPFLIQFAELVGPYGVGAALLAANGLIYDAWSRLRQPAGRRALAALLVGGSLILLYDAWAWRRPLAELGPLRIALIQPNVPLDQKHVESRSADQQRTLAEMTREAARERPDLVIWPESARPQALYHQLDRPETFAMPEVQALAREIGAAMLVGVEYARIRGESDRDWFNAAVAVDAAGRMLDSWGAKVYLVPFVEEVPFAALFGPLVEGRGGAWRWVSGGFERGPRSALIDVGGARVGVLVCYEEFFADLSRDLRNAGAEFQVVITNDAWFGRSLFQTYMANALRLRAIENRTWFVRVANTGISGFVDPQGRYHRWTALFEPAVEVLDVVRTGGRTVYSRTGDLVAWLAVAGLGAAIFVARGSRVS